MATRKTIAFIDSNITGTSGGLSGTPTLPNGTTATTQSANDNSTKLATTAYADLKAPLASPTFTGTVTAPLNVNSNNAITVASNAATVPVTYNLSTVTNNAAGAVTITITTTSAVNGQLLMLRFLDYSAVAQTLTFVNTENTANASVPATSKGSTSIYSYIGFCYNSTASKWDCIAYT